MTTLKGYVEKNDREFEWKSKPGACDTCKVLNGTSYTLKKDIPDKPHPNCKCKVENNFKNLEENQITLDKEDLEYLDKLADEVEGDLNEIKDILFEVKYVLIKMRRFCFTLMQHHITSCTQLLLLQAASLSPKIFYMKQ